MPITLELTEECLPTAGPYSHLKEFNRVQSTLLINGLPTEDCNLVLGTATSTGKTISAELLVITTLEAKKKVIYAAPMKALASEKYEEWKVRFPNSTISIITGDFKADNTNERLHDSDIIILTNEMLDVKTRGLKESGHWLKEVGLLIVDEAHIMGSDGRGPAAESGIIRLCFFVKNVRLVFLSATISNSADFAQWAEDLNGKTTYLLNTSWRPVPLEWHLMPLPTNRSYKDRIDVTVAEAVKLAVKLAPEKCLCFVHEKNTGALLKTALKAKGITADFHSADLDGPKKTKIEKSFRDRSPSGLRVLIATSTLAWGSVEVETNLLTLDSLGHLLPLPIGQLGPGSQLISFNEITKKTEIDEITHFERHTSLESYEVELEDGTILLVDYKHPFYLMDVNLVEAEDLSEGMEVFTYEEYCKMSDMREGVI